MTDPHQTFEASLLLQDRDHWRQRALQAEAMLHTMQRDAPLDPQVIALQMANHVNENASFQSHAYRKALLYVRDILGLAISTPELPADAPNVLRRLGTNVSLTLARFGDEGLRDGK